eukprot:300620-Alexandrium_andersonii.AAC.1
MSASLVGSEMCIRDRIPRSLARKSMACDTELLTAASERPFRSWSARAAVSYTHLTLPTICSV